MGKNGNSGMPNALNEGASEGREDKSLRDGQGGLLFRRYTEV
jgi:hypothetical protein